MQKILIVLILSSIGLHAQDYARGYNPERLSKIKDQLNANCVGDPDYCECIFDNVVTQIPFKRISKNQANEELIAIVEGCQKQFANYSYNPAKPAQLSLESEVVMPERSNGFLFERDTIKIPYAISNYGLGTSYDPAIFIEVTSRKGSDIHYERKYALDDMQPAHTMKGNIKFWGDDLVEADTITVSIKGEDALGSVTDNINNYEFYTPLRKSKQLAFYPADPSIPSKGLYKVDFELRNTGSVPLRNPEFKFEINRGLIINRQDHIKGLSNNEFIFKPSSFDTDYAQFESTMYPGEFIQGEFLFSVPAAYDESNIALQLRFSDDQGWKKDELKPIITDYRGFKQSLNNQNITFNSSIFNSYSDVDNVSKKANVDESKYAVIFGNQHYSSTDIYDVKFANRDAQIFHKYCTNILGVPSQNAQLVLDGSIGQMNEALRKISNIAEQEKNATVYFYYAGHGWPSSDSEPLLIPTDISVNQLENAIKLNDVTKLFRRNTETELIAFVDACYASESFAKQTRSVIINIKEPLVSGKQILFSAVSKNQEANSHEESKHGVFTYYLLESLKEKGGKISVEELDERLRLNVTKYVNGRSGLKNQVPQMHIPTNYDIDKSKWKIAD